MINDLAELQKLLKLCRKQGVSEITLQGTVIKFGDLPTRKSGDAETDADDVVDGVPADEMIFFSARPPEGQGQ